MPKRKNIDYKINTNVKLAKYDHEVGFLQEQLKSIHQIDSKVKKQVKEKPTLIKENPKPITSKERRKIKHMESKAHKKKLQEDSLKRKEKLTDEEKNKLNQIVHKKNLDIDDMYLIFKATPDVRKKPSSSDTNRKTLCQKVKTLSKKKAKKMDKRSSVSIKEHDTDTSDNSSEESENEISSVPIKEDDTDTSDISTDESEHEKEKNDNIKEVQIENLSKPEEVKPIEVDEKPKPAVYVLVDRDPKISEFRNQLPIMEHETDIISALSDNDIVVITGATGSGKTTQVPQFLYEAGYAENCKTIGITEPRRVAAVSMASRVRDELNFPYDSIEVGYHIRFDKQSNLATKIKFMTDGVLLQELKADKSLTKYSVIVIDEAHERSMHTDLLIGILKIIVKYRRFLCEKQKLKFKSDENCEEAEIVPLKLVIMSATLRIDDFVNNPKLFPTPPPVINVEGRQYKVDIKFSKHTRPNYLVEAFNKAVEIHQTKSSEGAILIFVTSQSDVEIVCKWLNMAFPLTDAFIRQQEANKGMQALSANQKKKLERSEQAQMKLESLPISLQDFSIITNDEEMELYQTNNAPDDKFDRDEDLYSDCDEDDAFEDDTIKNFNQILSGAYLSKNYNQPMHVLPLFSMLPQERQNLIWKPVPQGHRMVIVATNVAETSITIPDVKYVIDCGMEKLKTWDPKTGLSRFMISRITKSSAAQRAGRAGRVQNGECYRLYSSALFERMEEYPTPEVLRRPLEDVMLNINVLFNSVHLNFKNKLPQLPTMPSDNAICQAENRLVLLGALRRLGNDNTKLTTFGKKIAAIPLIPRIAKMLVKACQMNSKNMLRYTILMVSIMTIPNFYQTVRNETDEHDTKVGNTGDFKRKLVKNTSTLQLGDIAVLMGSVIKLDAIKRAQGVEAARKFALEQHIRWKGFEEIMEHQKNLIKVISQNVYFQNTSELLPEDECSNLIVDCKGLSKPDLNELQLLRILMLVGSSANVAKKGCDLEDVGISQVGKKKGYSKKVIRDGYRVANGLKGPVFIHKTSIISNHQFEWVVYQDLLRSEVTKTEAEASNMIQVISTIEPEWLGLYCPHECQAQGLLLDKWVVNQATNEQEKQTLFSLLPKYDAEKDFLLGCAKRLTYGENKLILPYGTRIKLSSDVLRSIVPSTGRDTIESCIDKSRNWFLRFFLDGIIFEESKMSEWRSYFKSNYKPEMILFNSFQRDHIVSSLIREASKLEYFNRKELESHWETDQKFLLSSYIKWIKPEFHKEVIKHWPPV